MMRRARLPLAVATLALLISCQSDNLTRSIDGPMYAVSDGAHDGNPDFFFLSPLFKNPSNHRNFEAAAFNGALRPAVEICELGEPAEDNTRECVVGDPIKRFAPGTVNVSAADQHYHVNWNTVESNLVVTSYYRIRVLVGPTELGFADIDPVSSGKDLKNVQTGEYIGLVDGRTLPIKFRIESGALCAEDGTACAAETINLAEGGGIDLVIPGEDFHFDVAPGTQATSNGQVVTEVTFNLEVCDGIDVDLPKVGQCLRVTALYDAAGTALNLSLPILISMCSYQVAEGQEELITLHQQDGDLIRALPHADPNCDVIGARTVEASNLATRGWHRLRDLAAKVFTPQPLYARTRTAVLHLGGGGETTRLGADCSTPAAVAKMALAECAPASAQVTPFPSGGRTISDFQFALPAKMDYVDPDDASRSAPAGTSLPTAVMVTDWNHAPVQGATVTFTALAVEGPGTVIGTAVSNSDGIAQVSWPIAEGPNTLVASGRGIAAQNNYPGGTVKPFMPDIFSGAPQTPVIVLTGEIPFQATGGGADLIIESLTHSPASPTDADLIEFGVTVKNQGGAAAGPFYVIVNTSTDGEPIETTTLGGLATPGSSLAAGESRTLCCWRSFRAAGVYSQTALADFHTEPGLNNRVPESNEENNTLTERYTVTAALGLFAFERRADAQSADFEIVTVNADGTGETNLTNNPALDAGPQWSPDGSRIAFQSRRSDEGDVWIMNADGSSPFNVTNNEAAFELHPSWSPDGTKIAYMSRTPFDQIFVINADGTNNTFIAGTADADAGFPSWSPDGTKIAFATSRDGNAEIYVMNADGSNPVNLTQHAGFDLSPVWSPDGTKIAWFTTRDGNGEIFVMNADGSNPVNVTRHAALDRMGGWSPDGRYLVFSSDRDGNDEIYVTTVDGFFVRRVTVNPAEDLSPVWRP